MNNSVSGERLTLGQSSERNQADHVARYQFAVSHIKDKTVLDVACGTGYGCSFLFDAGAKEVVGVDIDCESITYAKEHHARTGIQYEVGTASKLSYPDNHFDAVVTFETIEHLEDIDRENYLLEIRRVVKPDGIIILSTPNKVITSPWSKTPLNKYHVLEFYYNSLAKELQAAGMTVVGWYGQRFVHKIFTYRLSYVCVRSLEKLIHRSLRIYDLADGAEVRTLRTFYEPRYFVVTCKK